jgi:plastocyanin
MQTSLALGVYGSCFLAVGLAASALGATNQVTVHGFSFSPKDLTIAVGDTIKFTGGGNAHTVTGNDAEPFCGPGFFTTCTATFLTAGNFRFHCIPHAGLGMTGVVHVVEAVTSPFMVIVHGEGTVTPDLSGQPLLVGANYTVTATPAAGWEFRSWSGGVTSSAPQLNFVMHSNLVLEATFLRNPFLTGAGSYNGLFYVEDEEAGVQHPTSGAFTFTLTGLGKYSGRLQSAGKTYPFSGQFDLAGLATNSVKRAKTNALVVELALDTEGDSDRVTGRVLDPVAGWTAELEGDLAPTFVPPNTSPYQGAYTLIVTNEEAEFGDGFGTATIDAKGKLKLKATLGDGTTVSQSVPVSKDGMWPLYLPLYSGKGSILSWVQVSTNAAPEASLYGELSWIKPALPTAKYYREGFTNEMDLAGSIYVHPTTNKVLAFGPGTFSVAGGNLSSSFTNQVELGLKNVLTNLTPAQPLALKITPASGLFQGTIKVTDGGAIKTLKYKGALLQHQGRGAGFFLGVDKSGPARLEPAP